MLQLSVNANYRYRQLEMCCSVISQILAEGAPVVRSPAASEATGPPPIGQFAVLIFIYRSSLRTLFLNGTGHS